VSPGGVRGEQRKVLQKVGGKQSTRPQYGKNKVHQEIRTHWRKEKHITLKKTPEILSKRKGEKEESSRGKGCIRRKKKDNLKYFLEKAKRKRY